MWKHKPYGKKFNELFVKKIESLSINLNSGNKNHLTAGTSFADNQQRSPYGTLNDYPF